MIMSASFQTSSLEWPHPPLHRAGSQEHSQDICDRTAIARYTGFDRVKCAKRHRSLVDAARVSTKSSALLRRERALFPEGRSPTNQRKRPNDAHYDTGHNQAFG